MIDTERNFRRSAAYLAAVGIGALLAQLTPIPAALAASCADQIWIVQLRSVSGADETASHKAYWPESGPLLASPRFVRVSFLDGPLLFLEAVSP